MSNFAKNKRNKTMSKPIFAILRAAIALIIGILLALNPETATKIIVVLIGVLFLLIGIVSVIYNIKAVRSIDQYSESQQTQFPLTSVGCILFGLVLSIMPSAFITISMFILGAFLVLAGAFQIVSFRLCSKSVRTPVLFYVIPALVMLAGIFIFINPIESASLPMLVLGVSFIAYGIMETVLSVQTVIANKRLKKAEAEAEAQRQTYAADSETVQSAAASESRDTASES